MRNLVQQASSTGGAGGKGAFQILGETKIIADERMNALLVFATHQDMVTIKNLIKQLNVVLPQVLIEAIIMEVTIDNTKSLGVSAAQQPMGNNIATAGGYNNGQNYFPFLPSESSGSNAFPGNFTSTLPANMFSYWGNFNGNFDLAVQAAENDSRVNVLSTPRIQTSHGVEADLFVGETIPYVDSPDRPSAARLQQLSAAANRLTLRSNLSLIPTASSSWISMRKPANPAPPVPPLTLTALPSRPSISATPPPGCRQGP